MFFLVVRPLRPIPPPLELSGHRKIIKVKYELLSIWKKNLFSIAPTTKKIFFYGFPYKLQRFVHLF